MDIFGVGTLLYVLGMISVIIEFFVTLITSLQAKMFLWNDSSWWWFGGSAAAVIIGIVFAFVGVLARD